MDANEKFEKVLELQEHGIPRQEIYKICEWRSLDTLTRTMKKRGYVYDKLQGKYIQVTGEGQVTPVTEREVAVIKGNEIIDLQNDVVKEHILGLSEHYKEIMDLLAWYKTSGGHLSSDNQQVIEVVNQGIQIDLPKVASIKTSIRVNKDIWEQFAAFAGVHSEFVKGDLLAQALKEFMDKYN